MLGWEFPPFISGGLGTACYGLTKALSKLGTDVTFVLPRPVTAPFSAQAAPEAGRDAGYKMDGFEHVTFRTVNAALNPYATAAEYDQAVATLDPRQPADPREAAAPRPTAQPNYAGDLFAEVQRYVDMAGETAQGQDFDVVHAHDWMTFPAGIELSQKLHKPLVVHVHSTEFDRAGAHVDQRIFDIERRGMQAADKIIAVSHYTKTAISHHYGVDAAKIEVIYNAVEMGNGSFDPNKYSIQKNEKIVLFLGRITQQKGPEYFLAAAQKVLEVMEDVKFVMAGSGDLVRRTIDMAAAMGIGHKVLFTGFLRGEDVERVFKMADLYVMPSVSEPFGIAPLEAMTNDVPVLISKQSGVSEVLLHALKVDFWDVNEMANKIVAVLRHPPLSSTLREHGSFEVQKMNWGDSAKACLLLYEQTLGRPTATV